MFHKTLIIAIFTMSISISEQIISNAYDIIDRKRDYDVRYNKGNSISIKDCSIMFDCEYIISKNISGQHIMYVFDKGYSISNSIVANSLYKIPYLDYIYFDSITFLFGVKLDSGIYVFKNIFTLEKTNMRTILFSSPMHIIFIIYMVYIFAGDRKKHDTIKNKMNEYSIELRGIVMFAENLNHEVNNAVSVVQNKSNRLKKQLKDDPKKVKDLDYIINAGEQIETITKKLQGIKHFKHNSKNRTLYEVVQKAVDFAILGSPHIEIHIDEKLLAYEAVTISNIDLQGRLSNHVKNSIDAQANKIKIVIGKMNKNKMHMYIIDNGNGVPDYIRTTLFDENVSSKKQEGYVGGNGMYINRHIMRAYGGDIDLVDSRPGLTIFELIFKYQKIPGVGAKNS